MASEKLGKFLRDVSNWGWDEFARGEKDKKFTTNEAIIFSLIRACAMQQLAAIKIALNRLDGKLKTPVKIEMPKVFYLFPNATLPGGPPPAPALTAPPDPLVEQQAEAVVEGSIIEPPATTEQTTEPQPDLPSLSLRQTLSKMADFPRELPEAIAQAALQTEQWMRNEAPRPEEIPLVKSVVAAHLLILAQTRNIDALTEVFDQIDGKLVETIQVLGEDIYITSYSSSAPEGAIPNKDGVLQIEAVEAQQIWASKLKDEKS